jgi:NADH-ubiquinone oxidoreductase chain 1
LLVWVDYFVWVVGVLLGVAFFTLFERKVMGYSHFRLGPTKVGFLGLFQPFSDAVKLFPKEIWKGLNFSFYFFVLAPLLGLVLMLLL